MPPTIEQSAEACIRLKMDSPGIVNIETSDKSIMKIEAIRNADGKLTLIHVGGTVAFAGLPKTAKPAFRVEQDKRNLFKFIVYKNDMQRAMFSHMFAAADATMFAEWCQDNSKFPEPLPDKRAAFEAHGLMLIRGSVSGGIALMDTVAKVRLATFYSGSFGAAPFCYAAFYTTVMAQRRPMFAAAKAAIPDYDPATALRKTGPKVEKTGPKVEKKGEKKGAVGYD